MVVGLGFEKIYPLGRIHAYKAVEDFENASWPGFVSIQERLPFEIHRDNRHIPQVIRTWATILEDIYRNIYQAVEEGIIYPEAENQIPRDDDDDDDDSGDDDDDETADNGSEHDIDEEPQAMPGDGAVDNGSEHDIGEEPQAMPGDGAVDNGSEHDIGEEPQAMPGDGAVDNGSEHDIDEEPQAMPGDGAVDNGSEHDIGEEPQAMPDENPLHRNRNDILFDFEMVENGADDGDPTGVLEALNRRILHTRLKDLEAKGGVWLTFNRNIRAAGLMPNIPAGYEVLGKSMMEVSLKGYSQNRGDISTFLQNCLPNLAPLYKLDAPAETSQKSLANGVPHCLVYGRSEELLVGRGQPRQRRQYREIKRKKACDQSRSRSRSSSPEDLTGLVYREGFDHVPDEVERKRYPTEMHVRNERISSFTESHKPDVMFIDDSHTDGYMRAKLVVEVSSNVRYGDVVFYPKYVNNSTAQCVWSCFSSLQAGQTKMIGLCCFIEGFKGIKIEKNADHQWGVYETKFVHFTNSEDVGLLLATINDEVGVADNR